MKTAPQFDAFLGHSHAVNTKVELRAPDDSVVGELPVEAGTVTADATRRVARWSGDLTLAGLDWAPDAPTHPLSGLSGHYCSVQRSGYLYGGQEQWVEVARLWVYETQVEMSRQGGTLRVRLASPAALLERALRGSWASMITGTVQESIAAVLQRHLPYTATVVDSSTSAAVPADYAPQWVTALQVAEDLAASGDVRVYFDAQGRIVIRDTLPSLDAATLAPARQVSVDVDVVRYTLTFGRSTFSNIAWSRYDWDDAAGNAQNRVGTASIAAGALADGGPAGRLAVETVHDVAASQTSADAFAQSVLTSQSQAWVTSRIDAVQDPRIEPDDIVETRYLDRTLRHRVVGVQFDLTTDQMQITGRTSVGST